MPEIMRQFGQTIVVAVAGTLLIAMMFVMWPSGSGSVLDDLGARAGGPLQERAVTGAGTEAFAAHAGRTAPQARVKGPVVQGVEFILLDQFTITADGGAEWSQAQKAFMLHGSNRGGVVQVESITSADGTEHLGRIPGQPSTDTVEFSPKTGAVTFSEPGLYRVGLRMLDGENVEATSTIPLVVDFALQTKTDTQTEEVTG